ncbi:hypothetical protein LLEC1_06798 [Akanthomyces lecanii]|uniref:Uncharacterized protein n=1 Tax=Cordyceps confragosa TaxID=2714763 RepID=A0A179IAB3_CORDF|nr:hypothetical protein LLEC1_06798 [Akanthomyces lecanii]
MRSTFVLGGSQDKAKYQGTTDELDVVLAALMEELHAGLCARVEKMRPPRLFEGLSELKGKPL